MTSSHELYTCMPIVRTKMPSRTGEKKACARHKFHNRIGVTQSQYASPGTQGGLAGLEATALRVTYVHSSRHVDPRQHPVGFHKEYLAYSSWFKLNSMNVSSVESSRRFLEVDPIYFVYFFRTCCVSPCRPINAVYYARFFQVKKWALFTIGKKNIILCDSKRSSFRFFWNSS